MKVLLFGKNSKNIEPVIKKLGFRLVDESPNVVISFGGDGTLLSSEREYPGIPKLPIRDSLFCNKCPDHEEKKLLKELLENKLKLKEYRKLHTIVYGKELYALNDFVVRNEFAIHAIRFNLAVPDPIPLSGIGFYIGDGIVVATAFGSTGYYKSITRNNFKYGFAVALNNTTQKHEPVILAQDEIDIKDGFDSVGFTLIRGKAILSYDNSPDSFHLSEGTKLVFKLSDKLAKIFESSLRCPNCKVIRS